MISYLVFLLISCGGDPPRVDGPETPVGPVRAAGCVVSTPRGLLLVQNRSGQWSIPAGFVDGDESSERAAVRETREEAGIEVTAAERVFVVVANRFVAHRCHASEPPDLLSPHPDGTETFAADFLDRAAIAALRDDQLRFPWQRGAYLELAGD